MSQHTSGFQAEWNPTGASWDDITAYVQSVSGAFETTGSGNGVGFGDSSEARATLKLDPNATGTPLDVSVWDYVPIRVTFSADANTARGIAGVLIDFAQDDTVEFSIVGYKQLISTIRVYSSLFINRPIATKTTALSIENPASGGYAAGLLNWILWQAGGRPYEQAASYPSAVFYYSLSQAPIAPVFSWVAGEDAWEEAKRLVRAAGGQLYQRPDGVISYVSPLSIAGGASQFSLTQSDYQSISRKGTARSVVKSFACPYLPRVQGGMQEIVGDTTARVVAAGASITIELEPQYPITSLETAGGGGTQLLPEAISATFADGTQVAQGTGYTHTLTIAAQKVTIVISNVGSLAFVIERITLRGTPILPTEPGTVTVGSGDPSQTIDQSAYIQTRGHARRLARIGLAFYGTPRPIISARGVRYDPTKHQIGVAGTLTKAEWSLTNAPVVILAVTINDSGTDCDLELIVTTGLPKLSDYFLIQTASQAGLTRKIGY